MFKFQLNVGIFLKYSREEGHIVGRSEYLGAENQYLVRYVDGTGCQVENWLAESAISDC